MSLAEYIIIGLLAINTIVGLLTLFRGFTIKIRKQDGEKIIREQFREQYKEHRIFI